MAAQSSAPNRVVGLLVLAFVALFAAMIVWAGSPYGQARAQSASTAPADAPIAHMELEGGEVLIRLRPDLAPNHVDRITELANSGFYDGLTFHRVIPGFMAQTGDPNGNGTGGSDLPDLKAEFSDAPFTRGVVGMARTANPDSANSQFFITTADASHLNGQYTVFGEVIEGMDFIDGLKAGEGPNGMVSSDPDTIVSMRVEPAAEQ